MPITRAQIAAAEAAQRRAAHSPVAQVRLLAGPGTGKSQSILTRVRWLLDQGQAPNTIRAVSFTRASARDLEDRIHRFGINSGRNEFTQVRVSTLHSLALGILRQAGLLALYPVDPIVLDEWELRHVLDAEFGAVSGIPQVGRQEAIRRHYEAYCSTGNWNPPGLRPAQPPVSVAERAQFEAFLPLRAQAYSCVLPGELVKKCVDEANAGTLDLVRLAGFDQLIVDEYQDLNPVDLEFVDILARGGVTVFVAGDDDQSIYAFRHAAPVGIQHFHQRYPQADCLTLDHCFRCTPAVLDAAYRVVGSFPDPSRLPKQVVSLYQGSQPPVRGTLHAWRFAGSRVEARAIAESCAALVAADVAPEGIMILLSSTPTLARPICDALEQAGVPYAEPRPEAFVDSSEGRLGYALFRLIANGNDYVAARVLLGLQRGVGVGTCTQLTEAIIRNNVNLGDAVYGPPLPGLFAGRVLTAVNRLRGTVAAVAGWHLGDRWDHRRNAFLDEIDRGLGANARQRWADETAPIPDAATLGEVSDFISTSDDAGRERVLAGIDARLGLAPPPAGGGGRVRVMTMHGSKGLSARVVFIPGLEEGLMPSQGNAQNPGLVAEGARLLFVSISRARAACIVSYAQRRGMQGRVTRQTPSRYAAPVGGWVPRQAGLSAAEAQAIRDEIDNM